MKFRWGFTISGVVILMAAAALLYNVYDASVRRSAGTVFDFRTAAITPSVAQICDGGSQQFTVTVYNSQGNDVSALALRLASTAWTTSPSNIADVTGMGKDATVREWPGVKTGATTLTATVPYNGIEPVTAQITVGPYPAAAVCDGTCGSADAGCGKTVACLNCGSDHNFTTSAGESCAVTGHYMNVVGFAPSTQCSTACGDSPCLCWAMVSCGQDVDPALTCGNTTRTFAKCGDPPLLAGLGVDQWGGGPIAYQTTDGSAACSCSD